MHSNIFKLNLVTLPFVLLLSVITWTDSVTVFPIFSYSFFVLFSPDFFSHNLFFFLFDIESWSLFFDLIARPNESIKSKTTGKFLKLSNPPDDLKVLNDWDVKTGDVLS